jgi:hypothetical protein
MKYILEFVGVLHVRWDKGGSVITGDYIFIYRKGTKIINWEREICKPQNRVRS